MTRSRSRPPGGPARRAEDWRRRPSTAAGRIRRATGGTRPDPRDRAGPDRAEPGRTEPGRSIPRGRLDEGDRLAGDGLAAADRPDELAGLGLDVHVGLPDAEQPRQVRPDGRLV